MSLGILGGTFNPIHRAHLRLADAARRELDLARVRFVPAGDPPLKRSGIAPAPHRLEMVRRAVRGRSGFEVDDIEVTRSGPSYTIDTLRALSGGDGARAPWFVCGADALAEIEAWRDFERLFDYAHFAVAPRPGQAHSLEALLPAGLARAFEPAPRGWRHRSGHALRMLPFELSELSASDVRARIARGQKIDDLVPGEVARYIDEHQLYREVD
ncbi:MAG: nicotinate-nucleotide adenylyltransferase [Proteobacteria bacterium]|nr:nicotinate-nucleotide adenylyltransferase [Pseudomonadota bacterium]